MLAKADHVNRPRPGGVVKCKEQDPSKITYVSENHCQASKRSSTVTYFLDVINMFAFEANFGRFIFGPKFHCIRCFIMLNLLSIDKLSPR